jgi:hypothetical protein
LRNVVTESAGTYKVCKERIDAVEKALAQALGDTESGFVPIVEERLLENDDDEVLSF